MKKIAILIFLKPFLIVLFIAYCNKCSGQNISSINLEEVWRVTSTEKVSDIVIAVIDDGVLLDHKELIHNQWENESELVNNLDDDNNGYIDDKYGWNFSLDNNEIGNAGKGNWHGTPVNGILNRIIKNPAWGEDSRIRVMNLVKSNSIEGIISSLNYIYQLRKTYNETSGNSGAFIVAVNCSWGKELLLAADYPEWCAAYDRLGEVGVLVVNAVPNSNIDIELFGDMPSTCVSDYLITVTNSNSNGYKINQAGFGLESVDIAAPGEHTYTLLNTGSKGYFGGTSAATPYVTGVIGLLYALPSQKLKDLIFYSPSEAALLIKGAIMDGVSSNSDLIKYTVSGGVLDAYCSMKILLDYFSEQELYFDLYNEFQVMNVYPNPAQDYTFLSVESDQDEIIKLTLHDVNGRMLLEKDYSITKGIQEIRLELNSISSGLYALRVSADMRQENFKLIID